LFHVVVCIFFIFFFSSRRRHTRSKRDWSSDVCSSDLAMSFMDGELRRPTSSQELHGAGIGSRSVAIVATPGSSARFSRSERPGIVVPPFSRMPELSRQESTRACLV